MGPTGVEGSLKDLIEGDDVVVSLSHLIDETHFPGQVVALLRFHKQIRYFKVR